MNGDRFIHQSVHGKSNTQTFLTAGVYPVDDIYHDFNAHGVSAIYTDGGIVLPKSLNLNRIIKS